MGSETQAAPLDGHSLLEQLGREVAGTLSPALDRVTTLTDTGRIDRPSLRALRDEIGRARHAGILGQQLARLAQGRVALAAERLDLAALLQQAVAQRRQEMDVRGIEVRQALAAAEVVSDTSLLFALLQAALDWGFEHAAGSIALKLELHGWPTCARVRCAFAYHAPEAAGAVVSQPTPAPAPPRWPGVPLTASPPPRPGATLDTMAWRLVEQTALVLGLALRRRDARGNTELVLDFALAPGLTADAAAPATSTPATDAGAPAPPPGPEQAATAGPPGALHDARQRAVNAQPLAGHHVLVLVAERELRLQVREALRDLALRLDFVTSVDEARLFCADAMPHALVYDATQATPDFLQLRDALLAQRPALGVVQITDDGAAIDMLSLGQRDFASVGRGGLAEALPAALMFALFRDG